jgi:hypothetical protein
LISIVQESKECILLENLRYASFNYEIIKKNQTKFIVFAERLGKSAEEGEIRYRGRRKEDKGEGETLRAANYFSACPSDLIIIIILIAEVRLRRHEENESQKADQEERLVPHMEGHVRGRGERRVHSPPQLPNITFTFTFLI